MKYCILCVKKKTYTAGIKAPYDVMRICEKCGFDIIYWRILSDNRFYLYKTIWVFMMSNIQWIRMVLKAKKGDTILYQHPTYGSPIAIFWCKALKRKKVKMIAIVHDLESLRKGIEGCVTYSKTLSFAADVTLLKCFDKIICHNKKMQDYMVKCGFAESQLISLDIFDYLCEKKEKDYCNKTEVNTIAIAGNLAYSKSAYIYHIFDSDNNNRIKVNLYGKRYQKDKGNINMVYHGVFDPDDLPEHLEGDFGLVWDGNSSETCAGNTGEYLKYNNPHKTSLYLAAGLPVIVWSKAAIADFVIKNGLGITIDSIFEIGDRLKEISVDDYNNMVKNVKLIGEKIRNGYYTKKAIETALS